MIESAGSSAPVLENVAVKPKGIVPQNFQNWLMVGGGLMVVLFILCNSGPSAKDKKASAAAAAKPVIVDPSQARIQEYRNKIDIEAKKLEAEQARLQEVQQSMGLVPETRPAGAFQAVYPPGAPSSGPQAPQNLQNSPPVDPVKADREKREYASLFASNVALTYRPSAEEKEKAVKEDDTREEKPDQNTATPESPVSSPVFSPASSLRSIGGNSSLSRVARAAAPGTTADAGEEASSTHPDRESSGERTAGKKHLSPAELRQADGAMYRLFEGTVLETVLTNRVAADFSGPVNCLVSANVYSHNRQHLLIPQGSRVLGEVKRVENFGQQRVAVFFHRLIMPDGYSLDLDQFQGLNQIGETGLKDQVNHHYAAIFGSSLALGAIAGFSQAGASTGFVTGGSDSYREGFASSLSQSSQRILDKFLNQLPTVTIREGYRIKVYLAGDLLAPDYAMHRMKDDL